MYKVFIDNGTISFQKAFHYSTSLPKKFLPLLETKYFEEISAFLNPEGEGKNTWYYSPNPYPALRSFFKNFTWIEAAGGVVYNPTLNKYLVIFRNEKWDLPKGKIEENESPETAAIREIQEECGLNELKITGELRPTYHAYHAYNKHWLKMTHWFLLETMETETQPQLEEDITKTAWMTEEEFDEFKANTYASLIEVIEEVKLTK